MRSLSAEATPPAMVARRALLAICSCLCVGCSQLDDLPGCQPGIPPAARFLRDPAFAALKYHTRQQLNLQRQIAYDLWADSRFEYMSGLEYTLAPQPNARSYDDLC